MNMRLLRIASVVSVALAVPASIDYSARDGVQFTVTKACAQGGGGGEEEGCQNRPNSVCNNIVGKWKAF